MVGLSWKQLSAQQRMETSGNGKFHCLFALAISTVRNKHSDLARMTFILARYGYILIIKNKESQLTLQIFRYGNLIKDYDAFDHKFFRRPPREVLHMDPQQRFMLQVAYQAVAQSGYYQKSGLDKHIGCYLGMVGSDYENNVSHVHPNAFSATGALRSYISGKVSHYFGWTGPGMTVDTACSASTVAINLACQAILNGDCSAALVSECRSRPLTIWSYLREQFDVSPS